VEADPRFEYEEEVARLKLYQSRNDRVRVPILKIRETLV
jgi:hypothetical protein